MTTTEARKLATDKQSTKLADKQSIDCCSQLDHLKSPKRVTWDDSDSEPPIECAMGMLYEAGEIIKSLEGFIEPIPRAQILSAIDNFLNIMDAP